MTTKEMIRCKHCAYLVEVDGEWCCSDCDYEDGIIEIHEISDEDCQLNY